MKILKRETQSMNFAARRLCRPPGFGEGGEAWGVRNGTSMISKL